MHSARTLRQIGRKFPGQGGEGAVAVAGVVGRQDGAGAAEVWGRDGHVGRAVFGQDVVVAREELAGPVQAVFGGGEESADGGGEEGHFPFSKVEMFS